MDFWALVYHIIYAKWYFFFHPFVLLSCILYVHEDSGLLMSVIEFTIWVNTNQRENNEQYPIIMAMDGFRFDPYRILLTRGSLLLDMIPFGYYPRVVLSLF